MNIGEVIGFTLAFAFGSTLAEVLKKHLFRAATKYPRFGRLVGIAGNGGKK